MKIKRILLIPLLLLFTTISLYAEGVKGDPENVYKYRFGLDFGIKLTKGLKLNLEPELRFADGFDNFILNGGLTYKTFGCIYWGATYRLVVDRVENTSSTISSASYFSSNYKAEASHRYAFDVTYKNDFKRFTPSFRIRYNNFTDEDITDKEFLRYRAKLEYNIRKCKITPYGSVEWVQELNDMMLYKVRYLAGFEYKVNKKSSFSLGYTFDMFNLEYKNAHIFSAGYKVKF